MDPKLEGIIREINGVIAGKQDVVRRILIAILAEGHVLLDDVPGVGKTTMALALSRAVGLTYRRVQCTPDVLPSDLTGFSVYDRESGSLSYRPGALNGANLVLADEINRTSGRTQSALLEAMEERQVTVDGETHSMEAPFIVIATQNRVGTAGTQALPYAQMDRFMMRLSMGYPDPEAQLALLRARQDAEPLTEVHQAADRQDILTLQRQTRQVRSADSILDYINRLTMASRERREVEVGISPRGALQLDRASKAHALLAGRDYVTGEDVQVVFADVCAHRLVLTRAARMEGTDGTAVCRSLLRDVESPDRRA